MAAPECVDDDDGADQRQRHKGEPNFLAGKILGANGADLRADGRARVHDERDQNIDVAFDRMGERSVTGRDNDLEQIRPDREMGGNAEEINHRRHPNVTGAAAEKTAEHTADEGNENNYPKRN